MSAAEQYTDPYLAVYRRVPPAVEGVCFVCRSGPPTGHSVCSSCATTLSQVRYPVQTVLPISLYEVPKQYWHMLRYYKDDPNAGVRDQLGMVIAATIARFTQRHSLCVAQSWADRQLW